LWRRDEIAAAHKENADMAPCRTILLSALVTVGACLTGAPVARAETGVTLAQYVPERPYYAPRPYYGRPPPRRRQECWTERSRVFVGYDRYGRAMYRSAPRRVCRWRYY
jgi:hypothetical protein